jgi:hypothetical protein
MSSSERDDEPGATTLHEALTCVGCGFCCETVICRLGAMVYGAYTHPCPALKQNGNRYLCSLYLADPLRYEHFLDIGGGCCFPDNPRR